MNDFISNVNLIRKNWKPSNAWEVDLCAKKQKDDILFDKYPPSVEEKFNAKSYGKTLVSCVDKLDQYSINKSADAMIALGTLFSVPTLLSPVLGALGGFAFSKFNKSFANSKKITSFNGAMIGTGLYLIFHEYIQAQLEKVTTRIARFQSRNNELKDSSNFIVYTPEQYEKMGENQDSSMNGYISPRVNITKTYKEAFSTLNVMKNDYRDYANWRKDFALKEKENKELLDSISFSEEELIIAQKDRNKLVNTIYELELASNNEEINFQYAIDLVLYAAKMCGVVLATLLACVSPKMISQNSMANKVQGGLKFVVPFVLPIFALITSATLVKYQKDSAKLGRYEVKKELLKDERSFITYEDSKRDELEAPKVELNKTNSIRKVVNDIYSIKTMPKRLSEMYSTSLQQEVTDNTLEELNISDKQKQNAELLQKQLFYTFEKIDEKSEGLTDDVDVLLRAGKTSVGTAVNVGFNIFSLNLLAKRLKSFNGNTLPGFFESLKLMKNLGKKDLVAIFILPYAIKSTLCFALDTISARCRKKANKIGVMTAIQDLQDERVFTDKYLSNVMRIKN